jgi:hypothetical protein
MMMRSPLGLSIGASIGRLPFAVKSRQPDVSTRLKGASDITITAVMAVDSVSSDVKCECGPIAERKASSYLLFTVQDVAVIR